MVFSVVRHKEKKRVPVALKGTLTRFDMKESLILLLAADFQAQVDFFYLPERKLQSTVNVKYILMVLLFL